MSPLPADAGVPADGAIRGVVWFDRNHNGVLDQREWVLPGVTVSLQRVGFSAAGITEHVMASALPDTVTVVTAADGSYLFSHLPPGSYRVEATARIKGFDYTSDSDGALDWIVDVDLERTPTGVADFAGLGRGELLGKMFETRTNNGLGFAAVSCRWGGYDDVLGTADDVRFEVTAESDGTFDMRGVPYGNFTCSGTDRSGRTSADVAAVVFSAEPVEAPLPVDTAGAEETPRGRELPATGSDPTTLVWTALLLLVTGRALIGIGRRRLPCHS